MSRPWIERRLLRLVIVPLALLVALWGGTFALAKLHLAKPTSKLTGYSELIPEGDAYRGETIFQQTCSACHGQRAEGGVGPRLDGAEVTLEQAAAVISSGRGVMPAGLVSGQQKADVLAFLATILAPPARPE